MGHFHLPMEPLGLHILIDLSGIDAARLNDPAALQDCLEEAARHGGATVLESRFRRFEPQGVSGVVIISESHITVHTWPELGYAAIDVFTCGRPAVGDAICDRIIESLNPIDSTIERHHRGLPAPRPKAVSR
jgi:S-adenosylmethionine decarboxylase